MSERRVEDCWLELEGRRVFFRRLPEGPEAGDCPPLLLLHGISCCAETWQPLVAELARRPDAPAVLVPELPAHGRSEPPERILGIGDLADWTERLRERLEVPAADVMGHSMGGQIALALADRYAERVRRLVLLGPTTGGKHVSTLRNLTGLTADSLLEPLPYNRLLLKVFWRMGPPRYLLTVREMQRDDAFRHARGLRSPTLLLQGTKDAIVPKRVGKELARTLPRAYYVQIPGAAHAAQFSHPDATADAVLRFLRQPLGSLFPGRGKDGDAGAVNVDAKVE